MTKRASRNQPTSERRSTICSRSTDGRPRSDESLLLRPLFHELAGRHEPRRAAAKLPNPRRARRLDDRRGIHGSGRVPIRRHPAGVPAHAGRTLQKPVRWCNRERNQSRDRQPERTAPTGGRPRISRPVSSDLRRRRYPPRRLEAAPVRQVSHRRAGSAQDRLSRLRRVESAAPARRQHGRQALRIPLRAARRIPSAGS